MDKAALIKLISPLAEGLEFDEEQAFLQVVVPRESLHQFARQLKDNQATAFDYLFCQSGVDWPSCLEVVYHLESSTHGHIIVMKVKTADREQPVIDTVCDIWPTAEFHEREIFDLYGIVFNNHPDLRRLLLTEDWEGYPMRKDYKDEVNIVEM